MRTVPPWGRLIADGGAERRESGAAIGMNWELRCGVRGADRARIASRKREEVDQVTEMVVHPSRKEVTEALVRDVQGGDALSEMAGRRVPDLYEPPVAVLDHIEHESESYWWVIVVFFSAALAWAAYCKSTGGHPVIRATWRGFIIRCY
jgi:hypothetical protein